MFYECKNLSNINITNFNYKNVKNMDYMFYYCSNLNNSIKINNTNKKTLWNMNYMFYYCEKINYIELSNFDVSDLSDTFYNCTSRKHNFFKL